MPAGLVLAAAPPSARIGCTSFAACAAVAPNATAAWHTFMAAVKNGGRGRHLNVSTAVGLLWDAHLQSLHEVIPLAQPLLQQLPSTVEAHFGQ